MKRNLFLLLVTFISHVSLYGTHAAGMDISYQCISAGTPGTPTTTLIGYGSISVNIQTGTWANEVSWIITNSAGTVVAQGGQGSAYSNNSNYLTLHCLPQGTYTFNWYDSWGDGWNGGSYTVSGVNGNTIISGSPASGSSGSSNFTISQACANMYQTTYTGGTPDLYKIIVKFYRDCDGIGAPGSLSLNYSSSSCGINSSITLSQIGPGVIITPICPTMNSTCTGGSVVGIEEYTYETTISIPKCPDWIFSVEECCRNYAINTINSPGNEELRIEATLNNLTLCNNSPTFTQNPVPYICSNTPYCYNNGAIDIDGDSLVYSLITPLTSSGTVVYSNGYSVNSPVGGVTSFNYLTGNLCMNPPAPLTSVVAIKVEEFRNGVLIGSIIRDIQVNVLNCSEPPPYLSGIDTSMSVDSDTTGAISRFDLCTDGSEIINFSINGLTNSSVTNLTMNWNNSISGASFIVNNNGTPSPNGIFSWTPSLTDVSNSPFYFVVTVVDDACPLMGSFSYAYQINLNYSSGSFIKSDISCFGVQDGSIDVSVIGGYPPYNFSWIDSVSGFNSNLEDISNLSAGNYYCFITDSIGDTLGCGLEPIYVPIIEPLELSVLSSSNNVSCYSLSDGSINLNLSGGTPPYTVTWNSLNGYSGAGQNIINLPSDIYTATITDANNCGPIIETILIDEPDEITLYGTSNDVSCFGLNDGEIDLSVTGNAISFYWTGPNSFISNNEDLDSLGVGVYNISISDSNGCVGPSNSFFIDQPSDIIVLDSITNISCYDANDGAINLSISGGVGNFTTVWSGPNSYFNISEDIFTLSPGFYSYLITDADGCMPSINTSPLLIVEPSELIISSIVTDETCFGDADGSIDVTLNGTGSYSYSWSGPSLFSSSSLDIFSLEAGTYNLIVVDQNNCTNLFSETINIGGFITVNTYVQDISCNGLNDGSITLYTPNSNFPNFIWNGPSSFNSSTSFIDSLSAGTYSVIVNDSSDCPTQLSLSISEPSILQLTSNISNETCENYNDGEISVNVSGGIPSYSYVWSNAVNSSINTNLSQGEYILNAFDANNCIISDTFIVNLYLFDTTRQITNVSCYGGSNGYIDLEIIGGTSPFTYLWSNSDTTQDIGSLSSLVYSVSITDATNCVIYRDVVVTEPQELSVVSNVTSILCYGDTTGTASLQISGGVFPYILDWGTTNPYALTSGYHIYSVTDSNLCKFIDSVQITEPDSIQIIGNVNHVKCFGDFTGEIELQVIQGSGTPPYSYFWNGPNNFVSTDEDIYQLEAGDYFINVTDMNLCNQSLILTVDQPVQLPQTVLVTTSSYTGYNVRCRGENSAWIDISILGGYAPHTLIWNNGETSDSIYNLYAGTYSLTISDSLECIENLSINLNEPPTYINTSVLEFSDYNGYHISCFGANDGIIYAISNDGVPPYTYEWNNGNLNDTLSDAYSGYYEVVSYDANKCLAIDSITLIEPSELFFDLSYFPDTCSKGVGYAEVSPYGGVGQYYADWGNSITSLIIDNLFEDVYNVVVLDNNNCSKEDIFIIDNLISPVADFEAYPYHKRFLDQKDKPFYFVDQSKTFWSKVQEWNWDFGDFSYDSDSIVSHSYDSHGEYTVNLQIVTEHNCIDTISKTVVVDEYSLYIPNSFIPSSENIENQIFKVYGIGVEIFRMKIFSRWGELVFESDDLDQGWDGTYDSNSQICPQGIYTYSVNVENIYGEVFEYQGQLKLLR